MKGLLFNTVALLVLTPCTWNATFKPDGSAQLNGNDGRRLLFDTDTGVVIGEHASSGWSAEIRVDDSGHKTYWNDDAPTVNGSWQEQEVDRATYLESLESHTGLRWK